MLGAVPSTVAQPAARRGYLVHDLLTFFNQNNLGGLHPRQAASKLAGLDSGEYGEGEQSTAISIEVRNPRFVVLTIQRNNLLDDAIAARRTRVEYQQLANGRWEPLWAGDQFRCRRAASNGWRGSLCP